MSCDALTGLYFRIKVKHNLQGFKLMESIASVRDVSSLLKVSGSLQGPFLGFDHVYLLLLLLIYSGAFDVEGGFA